MTNLHDKIAKAFARLLKKEIGETDYETVITLNDVKEGYCLSHNYCDANMVMLAALEEHNVSLYNDAGEMTDDAIDLINTAWEAFKRDGNDL